MNLNEILANGGGILLVILTLVEIAPVKINPWSKIMKCIGRALDAEVLDKLNESRADTARYRILRFDDEIRHKQTEKHTEEHFNQILVEIDEYERYCKNHPDYRNSRAVLAIENVRQVYSRCRSEHSFLV